jgi:hypothetical protein
MELSAVVPWRVRLGVRKALGATIYGAHFNKAERLLQHLRVSGIGEHLITRAIKGVGPTLFDARCIEARTVPGTWEQVIQMMPMDSIQSIADVGCGQENPGRVFEKMGKACAYSDIEHFEELDGFKDRDFRQMDFNHGLQYADKQFDYAVCIDVIEHVENTRAMCRELRRISKVGFIVATPNPITKRSQRLLAKTGYFEWFGATDRGEPAWHINPVFPWQMKQIAKEFGMDYEVSGNTNFFADHDPVDHAEALIYRFTEPA